MSQENHFTLHELANIALGGNSFGQLNISLLHTIINLTLKKLDCENEKVIISGVPAEHIQKMLEESSIGPFLTFDEKKVKSPMKQFEKIEKLENQLQIVECNLENHLTEVDLQKISKAKVMYEPCHIICEVEEQKDEVINGLLKNEWLTRQLEEYLSQPLMCRLKRASIKINILSQNMERLKKEFLTAFEKMDKTEDLQTSMLNAHKIIKSRLSDFDNTMFEIQEKMDMKVNNCDMITLKSNIKERIDWISNKVKGFQDFNEKPRACLSIIEPLSQDSKMESQTFNNNENKNWNALKRQQCKCDGTMSIYQISLPERIERISLETVENALIENIVRISLDPATIK